MVEQKMNSLCETWLLVAVMGLRRRKCSFMRGDQPASTRRLLAPRSIGVVVGGYDNDQPASTRRLLALRSIGVVGPVVGDGKHEN